MTKTTTKLAAAAAALLSASLLAGCSPYLTHYESPPVSKTLSDEVRKGCIALGMSAEEIEADQNACLTLYWTPERLRQSERTYIDWWADNGKRLPCDVRDRMNSRPGTCDGIGGLDELPMLPKSETDQYFERDPWWDAQPTRDPGRTSSPLDDDGYPNTPAMPWYQAPKE